jgi:hypothetical protein
MDGNGPESRKNRRDHFVAAVSDRRNATPKAFGAATGLIAQLDVPVGKIDKVSPAFVLRR